MLFALLPTKDETKLKDLLVAHTKLRERAIALMKRGSRVEIPPAVELKQLSFSDQTYAGGKYALLHDGSPSLHHAVWPAAMQSGFDVRGGDPGSHADQAAAAHE